jgi:hypothetical protein
VVGPAFVAKQRITAMAFTEMAFMAMAFALDALRSR